MQGPKGGGIGCLALLLVLAAASGSAITAKVEGAECAAKAARAERLLDAAVRDGADATVRKWEVEAYAARAAEMTSPIGGCAAVMAAHRNWRTALAIAGAETDWCRAGVGRSSNNCGGIRSAEPGREFRYYLTPCDGMEDIALTLEGGRYARAVEDGDVEAIGRAWCGDGPECARWAEAVRRRL